MRAPAFKIDGSPQHYPTTRHGWPPLPAAPEADRSNYPDLSEEHEANDIHWRDLDTQCRSQRAEAKCTQVFIEVAHPRRQGKRLDACSFGAFGQCRERYVTRGVGVAGDLEATQR